MFFLFLYNILNPPVSKKPYLCISQYNCLWDEKTHFFAFYAVAMYQ
jgi:hypothetical protein